MAGGAIAAALLALDPGVSPRMDAINHFAPIWLMAGLLGLVLALPLGRSRLRGPTVAIALVAVGLNGAKVLPEFVQRLGYSAFYAADAEHLKIIQFNAYFRNSTPRRAVDWLIAQQADIVVLQEAGGLTRPELLRLLKTYPYCSGCLPNGDWGNLIVSQRRPVAQGRFQETGLSAIQGGWSRFSGPGGDFTVAGVHLAWSWRPVAQPQHASLTRFVSRLPKDRTIVSGDFNMTPWSHSLRRMDASLGLRRVTHGISTWPAGAYYKLPRLPVMTALPYVAIDQVYAGQSWRPVRVRRGPNLGSDHYPVIVELVAS